MAGRGPAVAAVGESAGPGRGKGKTPGVAARCSPCSASAPRSFPSPGPRFPSSESWGNTSCPLCCCISFLNESMRIPSHWLLLPWPNRGRTGTQESRPWGGNGKQSGHLGPQEERPLPLYLESLRVRVRRKGRLRQRKQRLRGALTSAPPPGRASFILEDHPSDLPLVKPLFARLRLRAESPLLPTPGVAHFPLKCV